MANRRHFNLKGAAVFPEVIEPTHTRLGGGAGAVVTKASVESDLIENTKGPDGPGGTPPDVATHEETPKDAHTMAQILYAAALNKGVSVETYQRYLEANDSADINKICRVGMIADKSAIDKLQQYRLDRFMALQKECGFNPAF